MKVILISGKAMSGKDTTAQIMSKLLKRNGKRVLVTHYADLLKFICKNYFGWDGKKDKVGRRMLQYVGTDIIRKYNPNFWVSFVALMLKCFHENWDYVIIPDCRFQNEISTMVNSGFDTVHIRVIRSGFKTPLTEEQQNHPSETALDNISADYYIHNDGTLKDLTKIINNFINENI